MVASDDDAAAETAADGRRISMNAGASPGEVTTAADVLAQARNG
jgi:hypothetical protein